MAIALYARKSIENENSVSCETQLEYCRAMLKPDERNEQKILTFVDNGFSGGNTERDGFQMMMKKIQQGKVRKVIVYRLDRISRSLSDFVKILDVFKEHDVEFVSSQESFDTSSPYGELIVKILAVFAEFERQTIISRVTQAYEHRSELGLYMGGNRPYGFNLEPVVISNIKTKRLAPIPEEVAHIRYIYETYAVENVTLNRLLKNMTEHGMIPMTGSKWTTAKLSSILKNPIYVKADSFVFDFYQNRNTQIISPPESFDGVHGLQLYGKTKHDPSNVDWADMKIVVMTHEGVIDSETWLKCQRKLVKNRQVGTAVSNKTSWLGGKIVCGQCGRTMTTIKGKTGSGDIRRYFNCTGKSHYRDCRGVYVTVYAESLEDMVYEEIRKKMDGFKTIKRFEQKNISPELNDLRNKLKGVELAEGKLADMLLNPDAGNDLLEILSKRATKLKADRMEIVSRIEEMEAKSVDVKTALDLSRKWRTATFEEKRGVCSILIDRIIMDKDGDAEIVWNC